MKNPIVAVVLFTLQLFLTFKGEFIFGKYLNPFFLFGISVAIPSYLMWLLLHRNATALDQRVLSKKQRWLWSAAGIGMAMLIFPFLQKAFVQYYAPDQWSDVIPQVQTLYDRFVHGEFPYKPINIAIGSYVLQPIYMPFQWLPVGLGPLFGIDLRWTGFFFFCIAMGIYGWHTGKKETSVHQRTTELILPTLPLWAYIIWGGIDLMVSFEIVVGAYYLILACGLISRKLWLIVVGIILCLLSRYTLIFWLPLFALILLQEFGWKISLRVWTVVVLSLLVFYFLPFYLRDPDLLKRGVDHYNIATVHEWNGYGDPPVSWTHERSITFAPHMKALFNGEMEARVFMARITQLLIIFLLLVSGWWAFRRWRDRMDIYTFSLISLMIILIAYYFFAPLTYRYYLFSLLVMSGVLCGKIAAVIEKH